MPPWSDIQLGENTWAMRLDTVGEDGFELVITRNGIPAPPRFGWTEDEQGHRTATFEDGSLRTVPRRTELAHESGGQLTWLLHLGDQRIDILVRDHDKAARFVVTQRAPRDWGIQVQGPFKSEHHEE